MTILISVGPKLTDEQQDRIKTVVGEFRFHEIQTSEPEDWRQRKLSREIAGVVSRFWDELTANDPLLPAQHDTTHSTSGGQVVTVWERLERRRGLG